jgi:WXG100 family type VII secretion target
MADKMTHDADQVMHGASVVRQTRNDVDGDLAKLRGAITTLVTEGWKGSASEAFHGTMNSWDANVKKLLHAMDEIAKLLDNSAHTFTSVQQEVEKSMRAADYSGML